MTGYSVCPEGGTWEATDRPKADAATMEMTVAELVVWTMRDLRDQWVTTGDLIHMFPGDTNRNHASRLMSVLYHAGVLDRELVEGTGRYRYRWLGSGPGGVR